jgi:hypothetical protein
MKARDLKALTLKVDDKKRASLERFYDKVILPQLIIEAEMNRWFLNISGWNFTHGRLNEKEVRDLIQTECPDIYPHVKNIQMFVEQDLRSLLIEYGFNVISTHVDSRITW